MKDLKIKYNETFGTKRSRDYYRGLSFHFSGKWLVGVHYFSDDYVIDFVTINNCLLACAKSHLSLEENKPTEFIVDDKGNITGVASQYWDFVCTGLHGDPIEIRYNEETGELEVRTSVSDWTPIVKIPQALQELGNSEKDTISQKVITEELNNKISKSIDITLDDEQALGYNSVSFISRDVTYTGLLIVNTYEADSGQTVYYISSQSDERVISIHCLTNDILRFVEAYNLDEDTYWWYAVGDGFVNAQLLILSGEIPEVRIIVPSEEDIYTYDDLSYENINGPFEKGAGFNSVVQKGTRESEFSEATGAFSIAGNKLSHATAFNTSAFGKSTASADSAFSANEGTASASSSAAFNKGITESNKYSFAINEGTATGLDSFASGKAIASGNKAVAFGNDTKASGENSFTRGKDTAAIGAQSVAEGEFSRAYGARAIASGYNVTAVGAASTAFGKGQKTLLQFLISGEARATTFTTDIDHDLSIGDIIEVDLEITNPIRKVVDVPDQRTIVLDSKLSNNAIDDISVYKLVGVSYGPTSSMIGDKCNAVGEGSYASGFRTLAIGQNARAEGNNTVAIGQESYAEGKETQAISESSIAMGKSSISGLKGFYYKHIQRVGTAGTTVNVFLSTTQVTPTMSDSAVTKDTSIKPSDFLETGDILSIINDSKYYDCLEIINFLSNGGGIQAKWIGSAPFNSISTASTPYTKEDYSIFCVAKPNAGISDLVDSCVAIGAECKSVGGNSVALGYKNETYGKFGFSEGRENRAGYAAHAEGQNTQANGTRSHSEGYDTIAEGNGSHVEGQHTKTVGQASHAEGYYTQTPNVVGSHAEGKFNNIDGNPIHSVGIGEDDQHRVNAFEIMPNGNAYLKGVGNYNGTNPSSATPINELIGKSDVFVAEYGVTTLQEISDAVSNGKAVLCNKSGATFSLVSLTSSYCRFNALNNSTSYYFVVNSPQTWSQLTSKGLEETGNKVSTLSSSSTNTQYAGAKAVVDYVAKIGEYELIMTITPEQGVYRYELGDPAVFEEIRITSERPAAPASGTISQATLVKLECTRNGSAVTYNIVNANNSMKFMKASIWLKGVLIGGDCARGNSASNLTPIPTMDVQIASDVTPVNYLLTFNADTSFDGTETIRVYGRRRKCE